MAITPSNGFHGKQGVWQVASNSASVVSNSKSDQAEAAANNDTLSVVNHLFNHQLQEGIASKTHQTEQEKLIAEAKQEIEKRFCHYKGVHPQLNLLKILRFRVMNDLLEINSTLMNQIKSRKFRSKKMVINLLNEKNHPLNVESILLFDNLQAQTKEVNEKEQKCYKIVVDLITKVKPLTIKNKERLLSDLELLKISLESFDVFFPLLTRSFGAPCFENCEEEVRFKIATDEVLDEVHKSLLNWQSFSQDCCSVGRDLDRNLIKLGEFVSRFEKRFVDAFKEANKISFPLNITQIHVKTFGELLKKTSQKGNLKNYEEMLKILGKVEGPIQQDIDKLQLKPTAKKYSQAFLSGTLYSVFFFKLLLSTNSEILIAINNRLKECTESYDQVVTSEELSLTKGIFRPADLLCNKVLREFATLSVNDYDPKNTHLIGFVQRTFTKAFSHFSQLLSFSPQKRVDGLKLIAKHFDLCKKIIFLIKNDENGALINNNGTLDQLFLLFQCFYEFSNNHIAYEPLLNLERDNRKLQPNDHEHQIAKEAYRRLLNSFKNKAFEKEVESCNETNTAESDEEEKVSNNKIIPNNKHLLEMVSVFKNFILSMNTLKEKIIKIKDVTSYTNTQTLLTILDLIEQEIYLLEHVTDEILSKIKIEENKTISENVERLIGSLKSNYLFNIQPLKEYLIRLDLHAPSEVQVVNSAFRGSLIEEIEDEDSENEEQESENALFSTFDSNNEITRMKNFSLFWSQPLSSGSSSNQIRARSYMREQTLHLQNYLKALNELDHSNPKLNYSLLHHRLILWALVLEQTLKMTTLCFSKAEDLDNALSHVMTGHNPAEFGLGVIDKANLEKLKLLSGIIAGPSRYLLGSQAILKDIEGCFGQFADSANLESFENTIAIFKDIYLECMGKMEEELKIPLAAEPLGQKYMPLIDGLVAENCFNRHSLEEQEIPVEGVLAHINSLVVKLHGHEIVEVSVKENHNEWQKRSSQVRLNQRILAKNIASLKEVLADKSFPCLAKTTMTLTRAAAIYEKTLQSLLAILPIASQDKQDTHYLFQTLKSGLTVQFSHKTDDAGKKVHSILQNPEIEEIAKRQKWVEQYIAKVYRYPHTASNEYGAESLRRFATLSELRIAVQKNDLSESEKLYLQELLRTDADNLLSALDQVIQNNFHQQILVPIHQLLSDVTSLLKMK